MELKSYRITHDKPLLDPNNYRFHDLDDYKPVTNAKRYGESGVQERARYLLESTESFELEPLKESIRTNGYVPLEQIVVEGFDVDENGSRRYLVIEGNRRVAAVRSLLKESLEGALDIPADKLVLQRTFRARSRLQDVPPGEGIGVIWASPNSVRLKGSL